VAPRPELRQDRSGQCVVLTEEPIAAMACLDLATRLFHRSGRWPVNQQEGCMHRRKVLQMGLTAAAGLLGLETVSRAGIREKASREEADRGQSQ
jgi:hypothetical protein